MRKLKVRHERLSGVGDVFEFDTASGATVTVVTHRSGKRDLAVGRPEDEEPLISASLTRTEAIAVATFLTGAHIELSTTPRT